MESKNEKIYFGRRDTIHIIDLTQTLELTNAALKKFMKLFQTEVKYYLFQQKNKHQKILH